MKTVSALLVFGALVAGSARGAELNTDLDLDLDLEINFPLVPRATLTNLMVRCPEDSLQQGKRRTLLMSVPACRPSPALWEVRLRIPYVVFPFPPFPSRSLY